MYAKRYKPNCGRHWLFSIPCVPCTMCSVVLLLVHRQTIQEGHCCPKGHLMETVRRVVEVEEEVLCTHALYRTTYTTLHYIFSFFGCIFTSQHAKKRKKERKKKNKSTLSIKCVSSTSKLDIDRVQDSTPGHQIVVTHPHTRPFLPLHTV